MFKTSRKEESYFRRDAASVQRYLTGPLLLIDQSTKCLGPSNAVESSQSADRRKVTGVNLQFKSLSRVSERVNLNNRVSQIWMVDGYEEFKPPVNWERELKTVDKF